MQKVSKEFNVKELEILGTALYHYKQMIDNDSPHIAIVKHLSVQINEMERLKQKETATVIPVVGMGATGGFGSDCYPYTIVSVSKDLKKIEVTADKHKPADGYNYYDNQVFNYTSDMNAPRTMYRLRKNGRYVKDGEPMKGGASISIGNRRYYQDPSF